MHLSLGLWSVVGRLLGTERETVHIGYPPPQ